MTDEQKIEKIKAIHAEAMKKLEALAKKRQAIVSNYIKELESQKADTLRASILSDYKN